MLTKKRRNAAKRLLAVQEKLKERAEWKLLDLRRQQVEAEEKQRALDHFLDADRPAGGVLLDAVVRQRRKLAEHAARLRQASEIEAEHARGHARRTKLAERRLASLEEQHRRESEKRELAELIERLAHRNGGDGG